MALVLDTHIWLWFARASPAMNERQAAVLTDACRGQDVFVSVISIWEVAFGAARGRINLYMPCEEWIASASSARGIEIAQLTPEIAIASTRLPGEMHRAPADRFIVATARALGATLVTRDRRLVAYGRAGHLDVLEA